MSLAAFGCVLLVGESGCADEDPCPDGDCPCIDAKVLAEACCHGFSRIVEGQCIARTWPPARDTVLGEPGSDNVEVVVDGTGQPVVGWLHNGQSIEETRPMLAERDDRGWRTQSPGDPANGLGTRVTLAASPNSRVAIATWAQYRTVFDEDGVPRDRSANYLATRDEDGAWSFLPPGTSLSFGDKTLETTPLVTARGEVLIAWDQWRLDGEGYGVALARRAPGEETFTIPTSDEDLLSPPVFFSNDPQIAVGDNGDAVIAWYQSVGDGLRMFVSERSGLDGEFNRPATTAWLSPDGPPLASHEFRNPVVAMGAFGDALVVWSQEHPSGATALYLASRDGFGVWTPPSDIDDTFAPLGTFATCADVEIGPRGEAFVVWFDGPPGATTVYGAHRDEAFRWDAPPPFGEALSSPGNTAEAPALAVGPDGEAVVVWSERRDGLWRVMTRRRNPSATRWGAAVEVSDPSSGDALEPAVSIGGQGAVAIAWKQGPARAEQIVVATLR